MRSTSSPFASPWLWGCLALGAGLRLFRIGHQNLWIDEMITLQLATWADGREFWAGLLRDIHGPLNSVLLRGWLSLGTSEAWMRLLFAIPGIAAIPVVWRLARDLFDESAGKAAALVLAISPFHVWYSQEVRGYSWAILWIALALALFVRVWDGRDSARTWVALGGALALGLLTNFSVFFLLVTLSVLVAVRRPFSLAFALRWVGVLAIVGLAFVPWFVDWFTRIGAERMFVDAPSPTGMPLREAAGFSPLGVAYLLWTFSWGYTLGPSLHQLHLDRSIGTFLPHAPVIALGAAVVAWAAWRGVLRTRAERRALLVLGLVLVPVALAIFLALRDIKTFHPRYLVVFFPVFVAVLAAGFTSGGRVTRAAAGLALVLAGASLGQHYFSPAYAKEDSRSAARLILEREEPGDTVVVIYSFRPFRHYFADTAPGHARLLRAHKRFLKTDDDMRAHVADAREGSERVWLVLSRWWDVAPESRIRGIFEETLDQEGEWQFPGVKVLLYDGREA